MPAAATRGPSDRAEKKSARIKAAVHVNFHLARQLSLAIKARRRLGPRATCCPASNRVILGFSHPVERQRTIKTHREFVRRSTSICHTFTSAHFHRFLPDGNSPRETPWKIAETES